jgi:hypothetical protein
MSIVDSTVSTSPVQAHNIVGRHLMLTVLREQKIPTETQQSGYTNVESLSNLIFGTFRFAAPEIEIVSASALFKSHR